MTKQVTDAMFVGDSKFFPGVRHVPVNPHSFWIARAFECGVSGIRVWRFA